MTLTIIIPTRNEEATIGAAFARLADLPGCEIIVADGGSADATAAIARRRGAIVIDAPPGRGRQMNAGAAVASGETLLFLHADTALPGDFVEHVRRTLARPGVVAGAFTLRIEGGGTALRLVERGAALRSRWLGMPYGDQALFMSRATFAAAGGYSELPAMEDFELVRRLRRRGRIAICGAAAITSARRWRACGVWRTTLINQCCVVAFVLGVSAERIARWRGCPAVGDDEASGLLGAGGG